MQFVHCNIGHYRHCVRNYHSMKQEELIQSLQHLQAVKPSSSLHKRMKTVLMSLPEKKQGGYSFFFATRIGVMALLLLIVVGLGTAVAAQNSYPGNPFFPIKKAFIQAQIATTKNPSQKALLEKEIAEPTLSPMPTIVPKPTQKVEPSGVSHGSDSLEHKFKHVIHKTLQTFRHEERKNDEDQQSSEHDSGDHSEKKHDNLLPPFPTGVPPIFQLDDR